MWDGYGKHYFENGVKKYQGQVSRGKYEGYGKTYHTNGIKKFKGEFVNSEINGFGEHFDLDKNLIFKGVIINNMKVGKGTKYTVDVIVPPIIPQGHGKFGVRRDYDHTYFTISISDHRRMAFVDGKLIESMGRI